MGVITAHSHMADLSRVFILWLSSFVLPADFLRYFYIFLCLILGPLGMYFFIKEVLDRKNFWVNLSSFLGAIFYLLNLITVQQFLVPFEMFSVAYAFLPWIFLFVVRYLKNGGRSNLLLFSLVTLLLAPMAYASALYWAFFAGFGLFLGIYWLVSGKKWVNFKKIFLLVVIELLLNTYWIAPNIYSTLNGSPEIISSKINTLFSPEAFIRNQEYGNYKDVVLGRNFLFDWRAYDYGSNQFVDLMASWKDYLTLPYIQTIGYALFAISILGLILAIVKKDKVGIGFLGIFLLSLFFLLNTGSPLGGVYSYLSEKYPIFKEGFRMPFTKFSILYQFVISFYFAYFFYWLFSALSRKKFLGVFSILIAAAVVGGLAYSVRPIFEGQLISSYVETKLPQEYQDMFSWFEGKTGRIAKLPMYTLWGWEYHNWKYEGSGFIPFGIENPTLDRDFDRWSSFNESFYLQASNQLYNGTAENFEKVLEKYQVKYILLDESVDNAGGTNGILEIDKIKDILDNSEHIKKAAAFGFLSIYQTDYKIADDDVWAPLNYSFVNVDTNYSQQDLIYQNFGDYVFSSDPSTTGFPFEDFDPRNKVTVSTNYAITEGEQKQYLILENKDQKAKVMLPVEDAVVESFDGTQGFSTGTNCDLKKVGTAEKKLLQSGVWYKASDGGVSCDWFYYPKVDRSKAWILHIAGDNLQGRSLKIYLQNLQTNRMDVEQLLGQGKYDEYFIIYPTNTQDKNDENPGYTLNVETRSFVKIASENTIEKIEFIPFDMGFVTGLATNNGQVGAVENNLSVSNVQKYGTSNYVLDYQNGGILALGQGYDKGWNAYILPNGGNILQRSFPWFWSKPLKHTIVNGWQNGWEVPAGSGQVEIVFWPQYLEWGGMLLAVLALGLIFI